MRFSFKNSEGIELKLFPELGPEVFSPFRIIHAIIRNNIANNKNTVINSQDKMVPFFDDKGKLKGSTLSKTEKLHKNMKKSLKAALEEK